MSNLISDKVRSILINVKEVFVYFDNSAIDGKAQDVINILLNLVKEKATDENINIKELLDNVCDFNDLIQSAIDDTLMRSRANYSDQQTEEKEAICNLFKARTNTLIMMLKARV